jgi:hypothetical protein
MTMLLLAVIRGFALLKGHWRSTYKDEKFPLGDCTTMLSQRNLQDHHDNLRETAAKSFE